MALPKKDLRIYLRPDIQVWLARKAEKAGLTRIEYVEALVTKVAEEDIHEAKLLLGLLESSGTRRIEPDSTGLAE